MDADFSFDRLRIALREKPISEQEVKDLRFCIKVDEDKLVAFAPASTEGLMYDCDYYFSCSATQEDVYSTIGLQMVDLALQGLSSNVVLFGFAETGKTYTLYGDSESDGLIHNTVKELYHRFDAESSRYDVKILMRYWEMNRDAVEDCLREGGENGNTEPCEYFISHDSFDRLTITNLTTVDVPTVDDFLRNLNLGNQNRVARSIERMARWHGFVQLIISTTDKADGATSTVRTMTFVHMKGNDCVGAKNFRGLPLKEGNQINVSVTLLCAAVIHCLEYREKRNALATTSKKYREIIRRSHSFFMECKFSRVMSQFICGFEASFVIGCTNPLQYNASIETLESLQLFRKLRCFLEPTVIVSERGILLEKLHNQETKLGADVVADIYNSDGSGRPLTEAEEKLLRLHSKLHGVGPKSCERVFADDWEKAIIERSKTRSRLQPGKVETHGMRKRIFLTPSKTSWYEGQWENGKFGGFGELLQKLSRYRGEFRNGLRDGEGTLWVRADVNSPWVRVYRGEWLAGKRDGFGISWEDNGDVYEGEWTGNKRNGFGRIFMANGDILKGQFRDDLCDGRALLLLNNGDWYDGYWAFGLREGPGVWCYVKKEQYLCGEWSKGICKCGTMHDMPQKTTNKNSRFIPRLGLLRDDEVLEMEKRKLYDSRVRDFTAVGREWKEPAIEQLPCFLSENVNNDIRSHMDAAPDAEAVGAVWGLDVE